MAWATVTSDNVEKGVGVAGGGGGGMGIRQWLRWPNQLVKGARRRVVTSAFPLSSPTIATTSRRSTNVLARSASLLLSSAIRCDGLPCQRCDGDKGEGADTDRASLRPSAPATPFWHTNPELCVA
uniref:Uncharacterized protein n=1 Tax=Oryza meridionalis TaxID=40149 RepID=A0A0E0ESY7_9ORYZ